MYYDFIKTPIGWLKISASDSAITAIDFDANPLRTVKPNRWTARCKQQLDEYFSGARRRFDLPLDATGTAFQKRVWQALIKIPYGKTCAYADIAGAIGKIKAVRAVGAANRRNPIPIVVPCHRVIGRDGSLTGFGGGLDKKEWLLKHESVM